MNKFLLLILGFIAWTSSSTLKSYTYNVKNDTDRTLLIQVELLGSSNAYFNLAKPGQTVEFSWPFGNGMAGFILGAIKYVIVDDYLLEKANFLTTDKNSVANPRTAIAWLENNKDRYVRKEATIKAMLENNSVKKCCIPSKEWMHSGGASYFRNITYSLRGTDNGSIVAYIVSKTVNNYEDVCTNSGSAKYCP